jgi:hypothetical protein
MENGKDGVLMTVREIRARAARLIGNDYYMTVQQLDGLAGSGDLSKEGLQAALAPIAARVDGAPPGSEGETIRAATGTPEGPDIPAPPESPAEPGYGPGPEIPEVPDSPTDPDLVPTPEIPPSPASPAEPDAPSAPETGSMLMNAPDEATAGSDPFLAEIVASGIEEGAGANGRTLPAGAGAEASPLPSADAVVAAIAAQGAAHDADAPASAAAPMQEHAPWFPRPAAAAEPEIADTGAVSAAVQAGHPAPWFPRPADPAQSPHSDPDVAAPSRDSAPFQEAAVTQMATTPAEDVFEAFVEDGDAEIEDDPDPAERTGFDELAEASWRRVQEVSGVVGAPASAASSVEVPPAPPLEPVASQAVEALNDGGSESRRSDTATHPEFWSFNSADTYREPAAQRLAAAAAEAVGEAESASETALNEAVAGSKAAPAGAGSQSAPASAEAAPAIAGGNLAALEDSARRAHGTTVPVAEAAPTRAEPQPEPAAAKTAPALSGADLAAVPLTPEAMAAETKAAVAAAAQEITRAREALKPLAEVLKNEPPASSKAEKPAAADPAPEKATRRGFFSRLFGSREAHR